jgi:hypothetical protein
MPSNWQVGFNSAFKGLNKIKYVGIRVGTKADSFKNEREELPSILSMNKE